ncbi:unnamed protein product [Cladocopium goreaui]|uniref:Uncharacterized protein n=1 Tax=Cladocopium goreaui TaxID=2562237 RepID=A0A9P1DPG4_9DINO|nr:unnamed protein product [Cladocopium goreaui]
MPWRGYAEPLSSPPTVPSPPVAQRRATETAAGTASPGGRVLWLLGSRCVELLLPSGRVRTISHTGAGLNGLNVPAGSRAVADPKRPGQLYLLENGSSTLWSYDCASGRAESLTPGAEATRFRSSLGSRFVLCGRRLLVTGTPNQGAHSPWIFDLNAQKWSRLPDAPCAILSSAVAVDDDDAAICILGGWSKMQSCHGYLQRLSLKGRDGWQVSSGQVPWRRPGAATTLADGRIVVGFGWMECASAAPVGSRDFKLLRRNGGAQQAETSASRLVAMRMEGKLQVEELSTLPLSDSFESLGEIFQMGGRFLVCIGRDHVQMFDMELASWQTWPLPQELSMDDSNSWVKHCGSWAVAFNELPESGAENGAAGAAFGDAW